MFGYIEPDKGELKMKELTRYRAFYCALCKSIGARYSQTARLTLNYDCAFFALALCNTLGPSRCIPMRCGYKPLKKPMPIIEQSAGIDFAADVNVALAYNKLCDDIADERGQKRIRAKVGRAALKQDYAKARRYNKALCGAIERSMAELNAIEKSMDGSIDAPAAAFAGLMHSAALCAPIENMPIRKAFAALGAALGRWVYIMDAWDDRARDRESGAYNAFNIAAKDANEAELRERAEIMLFNSLKEAEEAYMLLRPFEDGAIIENILKEGCGLKTRRLIGGNDDESV